VMGLNTLWTVKISQPKTNVAGRDSFTIAQ